jgi:hypothetical protein
VSGRIRVGDFVDKNHIEECLEHRMAFLTENGLSYWGILVLFGIRIAVCLVSLVSKIV